LPSDQTKLFDRDLSVAPAMSPDNYSEWLSLKQFYEFLAVAEEPVGRLERSDTHRCLATVSDWYRLRLNPPYGL
jgi:hypothetical protein